MLVGEVKYHPNSSMVHALVGEVIDHRNNSTVVEVVDHRNNSMVSYDCRIGQRGQRTP